MNDVTTEVNQHYDVTCLGELADYADGCGNTGDAMVLRSAIRHIQILDPAYDTSQKLNETLRQENASLKKEAMIVRRRLEDEGTGAKSATERAERLLVEITILRAENASLRDLGDRMGRQLEKALAENRELRKEV